MATEQTASPPPRPELRASTPPGGGAPPVPGVPPGVPRPTPKRLSAKAKAKAAAEAASGPHGKLMATATTVAQLLAEAREWPTQLAGQRMQSELNNSLVAHATKLEEHY
eukprot:7719826-Alexandrium_andersonii.AAC.1